MKTLSRKGHNKFEARFKRVDVQLKDEKGKSTEMKKGKGDKVEETKDDKENKTKVIKKWLMVNMLLLICKKLNYTNQTAVLLLVLVFVGCLLSCW